LFDWVFPLLNEKVSAKMMRSLQRCLPPYIPFRNV
jgi:hypothetical protein